MIETPLGVLLAMFQEDRWFWAVYIENIDAVECRFCDGRGERPETVQHKDGCVILLAAKMIQADESFRRRIKAGPKRPVFHGEARLVVYRGGIKLAAND